MDEKVWNQVREIVAAVAEVPVERVTPEARFEDLDVDSLRGLRIVAEIEKRFGIVIDETNIGRMRSMKDVLSLAEATSPPE